MALGLSVDLRERVVAAVDDGMRVIEAAKLFKVCDRVIYQWLKLREKTNSLKPITGNHRGHRAKIKDWDAFKVFIEAHKHLTVKKMIVEWEKINNETISESAMERSLKKIGYSAKKKLLATSKQMLKSEKLF